MDITPEALEQEFSLSTAVSRLEWLGRRDNGGDGLDAVADADDEWAGLKASGTSLDVPEALELLALGEVVARNAHRSQLVGIRAALRGGAGWEQIGAALDRSPGEAWDAYLALVDEQGADGAAARELAGPRPPS